MNVTTVENSKFARFSELWERLSQGDGFDRAAFFFIKTDVSVLFSMTNDGVSILNNDRRKTLYCDCVYYSV